MKFDISVHGGPFGGGGGVKLDTSRLLLGLKSTINTGLNLTQVAYNGEDDKILIGLLNNSTGGIYKVYGYTGSGVNFETGNIGVYLYGISRNKEHFYISWNDAIRKYKINIGAAPTLIWTQTTAFTGSYAYHTVPLVNDILVLSSSNNNAIELRNAGNGTLIQTMTPGTSCFCADPTDPDIVYSGEGGNIRKINTATRQVIWTATGMNPSGAYVNYMEYYKGKLFVKVSSSYGYVVNASTGALIESAVPLSSRPGITLDQYGNVFTYTTTTMGYVGNDTFGTGAWLYSMSFGSNAEMLKLKKNVTYAVPSSTFQELYAAYPIKQ